VLTVSGLKKSYGTQDLFADASFLIEAGERVALIGANGTGKSTLLKIICGEEQADGGIVRVESSNVGYLPQEPDLPDASELQLAVCGLTPELLRLAEELDRLEKRMAENPDDGDAAAKMAETSHAFDTLDGFMYRDKAKAVLSGLGFSDEEMNQTVSTLSGGQKTRAALARLLLTEPDFLILDEPTNDLDIVTLQILEEYLKNFRGCLIIVSHDRYFMDRVVDHTLVFHGDGNIQDFPGSYSQYRDWKEQNAKQQTDAKESTSKTSKDSTSNEEKKNDGRNQNRARRLTFKERQEFNQLEQDIAALEKEKKSIEDALCGGTTSVDEITQMSKRLPILSEELEEKEMRWLELSEFA
ncbi:MAG: ABC-F family ATP-binding cassette domain-containing protein, partial [Bacteroidaceae bacterium]|nr:ABC-F family ATP-binding cassette domain-containing protein [Bacteroidaceae bacterium]